MTSEIDELAESIMDCVMNSHHIPDAGISYVESFLPTKPQGNTSLSIELFEKVDKDRVQKVAIIFKTHEEAKKWYAQFKQHAMTHHKAHKKAMIIDNVVFKYGDYGKQLFQYVEYICEFIDQQAICVLQHNVADQDLRLAENYHFYYKIHWKFKGFMPTHSSLITKMEQDNTTMVKTQIKQDITKEESQIKLQDTSSKQQSQEKPPHINKQIEKVEKYLSKLKTIQKQQEPDSFELEDDEEQFDDDFDIEYDNHE